MPATSGATSGTTSTSALTAQRWVRARRPAVPTEWRWASQRRPAARASTAMGWNTTASGDWSTAMGCERDSQRRAQHGDGQWRDGQWRKQHGDGPFDDGQRRRQHGVGQLHDCQRRCQHGNGLPDESHRQLQHRLGQQLTTAGRSAAAAWWPAVSSLANGVDAIALGLRVNANGTGSVVLGSDATATTPGVFMYGDRSTTNDLTINASNEFLGAGRRRHGVLQQCRDDHRRGSAVRHVQDGSLSASPTTTGRRTSVTSTASGCSASWRRCRCGSGATPPRTPEFATWARPRRTSAPPSVWGKATCASAASMPTASRWPP